MIILEMNQTVNSGTFDDFIRWFSTEQMPRMVTQEGFTAALFGAEYPTSDNDPSMRKSTCWYSLKSQTTLENFQENHQAKMTKFLTDRFDDKVRLNTRAFDVLQPWDPEIKDVNQDAICFEVNQEINSNLYNQFKDWFVTQHIPFMLAMPGLRNTCFAHLNPTAENNPETKNTVCWYLIDSQDSFERFLKNDVEVGTKHLTNEFPTGVKLVKKRAFKVVRALQIDKM